MPLVKVNIVMQGLIALAPLFDGGSAQEMAALVIDSSNPPSESVCMMQHTPEIVFPAKSPVCIGVGRSISCTWVGGRDGGTCTCPLKGPDRPENRFAISLTPGARPGPGLESLAPPRPIPFTNDVDREKSASISEQFSYVPSLSRLDEGIKLNPQVLGESPPEILAARFQFPFDSFLVCDFSSRPDDGGDNVHALEFRKLGQKAGPRDPVQAAAQRVVAGLTIDVPDGESVTLTLTRFGDQKEFKFPLWNHKDEITLRLKNHRPEKHRLPLDDPCDGGVGRDFALFYELAESPPPWDERSVPRIKPTLWKGYNDVVAQACEDFKGVASRPICPMASFH